MREPRQNISCPDYLVPPEIVARIASEVSGYSLEQATGLCDEISARQTGALAHVIALSRQGVPYLLLDHAIHLLMVFYASFREAGAPTQPITEHMIDEAWSNNVALWSYYEKEEEGTERERLVQFGADGYREPHLLAYWLFYVKDTVLLDGGQPGSEMVFLATKSLLDCFIQASA